MALSLRWLKKSAWHEKWHRSVQHEIFKRRYYRRLFPALLVLILVVVAWCAAFVVAVAISGASSVVWQPAFLQGVLANLLVLPLAVTVGVFVGMLVQTYFLRFQARNAGDVLAEDVRVAIFKSVAFLRDECGLSINKVAMDMPGGTPFACADRARRAVRVALRNDPFWGESIPSALGAKLDDVLTELTSSFARAGDLRFAFPKSFDSMERLRAVYWDGRVLHSPPERALMIVDHATDMLLELE